MSEAIILSSAPQITPNFLFHICTSVSCTLIGTKMASFPTIFLVFILSSLIATGWPKVKYSGNHKQKFLQKLCDPSCLLTGFSLTWLQTLRQLEINFEDLGVCLFLQIVIITTNFCNFFLNNFAFSRLRNSLAESMLHLKTQWLR